MQLKSQQESRNWKEYIRNKKAEMSSGLNKARYCHKEIERFPYVFEERRKNGLQTFMSVP